MEFCEAGDLFTLITNQRGKPLQEEFIFFLFLQVAAVDPQQDFNNTTLQVVLAVKYIHGLHILHRDIKTQNIFVTKVAPPCLFQPLQGWRLKLGDFGIARILDGTVDYARTCIGAIFCSVS